MKKYIYIFSLIISFCINAVAQDIFRFEHFSSKDGLSQNTVTSLLSDQKGYLWIGTMNGLNRYDGYQFKIYKNNIENPFLTNNRIIDLWQDANTFIWLKTYDNYYHFLNPRTEKFQTLPEYSAHNSNKTNHAVCFSQQDPNNIWIGTSNGGAYHLKYNLLEDNYQQTHYSDKGKSSISNNKVRFIYTDRDSTVWIGTDKGLNLLTLEDQKNQSFDFQHLFIDYSFTSVIQRVEDEIWFGTDQGILSYQINTASFKLLDGTSCPLLQDASVQKLFISPGGIALAALKDRGLLAFDASTGQWQPVKTHGPSILDIYFDRHQNAWITAKELGLTRLDLSQLKSEFYDLTKSSFRSITDLERHVFYEDKDSNLWIGLHGSGLQLYNRDKNKFTVYTNNINDPNSLSSNIVHAITEDASGIMWLGTGQFGGGLEKVIRRNPAFRHLVVDDSPQQINTNVIRSLKEDPNGCIWVGTKSGQLHIFSKDNRLLHTFNSFSGKQGQPDNINIYTIFFDDNNYVWLGSKGEGLLISKTPVPDNINNYKNLSFNQYLHIPGDSASLPSNKIYSIAKGVDSDIWIGTFEKGIARVDAGSVKALKFKNYNTSNSNLSNDLVRYIFTDSHSNLWVATSFGLNLLRRDSLEHNKINFASYYHSPNNKASISYNDIIVIKEDSDHRLWFGTFGGGVNNTRLPLHDNIEFGTISSQQGLSNDAVFSIEEERPGVLWLSSENGLSRYDSQQNTIEVYNENNGLSFNNFSESTSMKLTDGRIYFGGFKGMEVIDPDLIEVREGLSHIELTNFQLFNKNVVVGAPRSPLKRNISYTKNLTLNHSQSSFSIEFSSLDFRDPSKTQYAYMLDGFDDDWVYSNNQTKATYTNLSPGHYTFKVKCTNHSGQWHSQARSLQITITPPWWMTRLAFLAYIILAMLSYFIIRKVIEKINRYRKDLEVEKTINSVKLKFFTNISHEIRTPLTLILGPIDDLLHKDIHDTDIRKQLKMIRKNANRMLQLVNQLLDFRKVQNNKMVLKVELLELNTFTRNIYESFIPLANHKGLFYTFKPYDTPINAWGDKNKLDSIIYNLISNAIKFTPEGKRVVVSVLIDDKTGNAQIKIIDQGPGIPDKDISDIFTRYTILSGNSHSGTGIGLSLAYELARLHGGNIELSSAINQGSSFWFNLPLDASQLFSLPHVQKKEEPSETSPVDHHMEFDIVEEKHNEPTETESNATNILIVEDNPEIADYIKSSLHPVYNCILASDGSEGVRLAKQENPDVIVTDIMMPKMDGYEMTRLLKEDFSTCHIPIIMMTAKTDIQDKINGIETGAEAYITKPLNIKYLKAVIDTFNNQRQLLIAKFRNNNTINPKTLKINSKDEDFLKNLVDFVEKNYSTELSVEILSNQCCVSRTVLYNKVKGLTGLSPLEFVRQLKLKIANQLLQKGYSVSEVAFQVGYNDIKYFSRLFKKQYGYPPSKIPKNVES